MSGSAFSNTTGNVNSSPANEIKLAEDIEAIPGNSTKELQSSDLSHD